MIEDKIKYPLSEIFYSPQGEGLYAGAMMLFIRFAGCTVGKPIKFESKFQEKGYSPTWGEIPLWQEECETWDGRKFLCDTNFKSSLQAGIKQLTFGAVSVSHVCITGGEPLIHNIEPLVTSLLIHHKMVHIETSGTIPFEKAFGPSWKDVISDENLWITVSPKKGYLKDNIFYADEVKILVDERFDSNSIPEEILNHELVWIQPINGTKDIDKKNLDICIGLLKQYSNFRLSTQLHKIWGVR